MSEKGVRLAQKLEVSPCIPVEILSYKRQKWQLSHFGASVSHAPQPRRVPPGLLRGRVEPHRGDASLRGLV